MKKDKKYIKVPWKTFSMQIFFLIWCTVFLFVRFDTQIFGMPLESFLGIWVPYIFVALATAYYIHTAEDMEDKK